MTRRYAAFLAACLLAVGGVRAADEHGQFAIRGAGLLTCGLYMQEQDARRDVFLITSSWVDGYITGTNQHADDTYDLLSFERTELLMEILDRHCHANPGDPIFGVLRELFENLHPDRIRVSSDKVTVERDGRETTHYVELLRRVQQRLKQTGNYSGKVNGRFDEGTARAIAKFQASVDLEPTGFPDQVTLWRLLRSE